jgi:hypothetical protein
MSSFLYTIDYNNMPNSTSSRRASSSTTSSQRSQFTMKAALEQLKPTKEQITPSGIYSPIIKRGSLFKSLRPAAKAQEPTPIYESVLRRPLFGRAKHGNEKTPSQSRKHSTTQARVDAALLR